MSPRDPGVDGRPRAHEDRLSSRSRSVPGYCATRRLEETLLPTAPPPAPGRLDPARPDTYNVRFGAERALIEKLERFAAVAGFHSPVWDIARIIERALDVALEVKDPERREAWRRRRAERRAAKAVREEAARAREGAAPEAAPEEQPPPSAVDPGPEKTRPHEAHEAHEVDKPNSPEPARSRTIPRAVRDRVLARAGHQCEFTSVDGRRCTARTALEIEHEEPFAIFGRHDESRMRAFCRPHKRISTRVPQVPLSPRQGRGGEVCFLPELWPWSWPWSWSGSEPSGNPAGWVEWGARFAGRTSELVRPAGAAPGWICARRAGIGCADPAVMKSGDRLRRPRGVLVRPAVVAPW